MEIVDFQRKCKNMCGFTISMYNYKKPVAVLASDKEASNSWKRDQAVSSTPNHKIEEFSIFQKMKLSIHQCILNENICTDQLGMLRGAGDSLT